MKLFCFSLFGFILAASAATAQDKPTVDSLMKQGFEVQGVFPTSQGPIGLILENDDSVMMCVVAETPQSAEVATQYCKPVR